MEDNKQLECCCCEDSGGGQNCIICGRPLSYFSEARLMKCAVCGREKEADAACEEGHFVCDDCHSGGGAAIISFLLGSEERDPVTLYLQVCAMKQVHLHGPEHHSIVPCVLMTAYRNNGGCLELKDCLNEAWRRGKKLPGGACGFLGVCGAAAGAGIFASILCEATPLTAAVWHVPQQVTLEALRRMTELGGPRCCKRTGRIAIQVAAEHAAERYGIKMPLSSPPCAYSKRNRECLKEGCPFYGEVS